jgi:hypothetical protein
MEDDLDVVGAVAAEMAQRWGVHAVRITRDYADLAEEPATFFRERRGER